MTAPPLDKGLLLGVICYLFSISLFAQNGPGGVGKLDASDGLVLWLIADSAEVNTSNEITSWPNMAGVDGLSMDTLDSGIKPMRMGGAINGHAEISFANVIDALESKALLDADSFPVNEATVFIVTRHDNSNQFSSVYTTGTSGTAGIGTNRFTSHLPWGNVAYFDLGNCCGTSDSRIQITYDNDWIGQYGIFTYKRDATDGMEVWRDNTSIIGPSGSPSSSFTSHAARRFYLGHSSSSNFQGDIAEIIVYKSSLNDAQLDVVNNYLSAKYNLTITNDYYAFDASHGQEVAGIGQSGSSSNVTAFSNAIGVGNASSLADDDFIMFGHDNGAVNSWITGEQPLGDTNFVRLQREWRFDTTGSPGSVTVAIDTTGLPAKITDFNYYYLWTDSDGDFSTGAVPHLLTKNDSVYEVSGINLSDGVFATVALYRPVVNFSQTSFSGLEDEASADFVVEIPYATYENITVDYEVSGTYDDGLPANGTFTITATQLTDTLEVAIGEDALDESDETIILDLVGSMVNGAVVGVDSVSTYTVNDNDPPGAPTVQFDAPFSYGYRKTITIDKGMVSGSSDLTDFPVLISFTDPHLASVSNGGNVENSNGYDIRFTYQNALSWLDHEMEYYDETTGEYAAWVRLPSFSASENTVLEIYYGNSSVSSDPSTSSVWVDYHVVFHFDSNDDSSPNGYNGVLHAGSTQDTTGIAGRSMYFDGNDVFQISAAMPELNGEFTISMWVRTPNIANNARLWHDDSGSQGYAFSLGDGGAGNLRSFQRGFSGAGIMDADNTLSADTWYYLTLMVDRTNADRIIYNNGVSDISDLSDFEGSTWQTHTGTNGNATIGGEDNTSSRRHIGFIDEVRVASVARDADWVATEYNSMDTTANYFSYSVQDTLSGFEILESTDTLTVTVALSAQAASDVTVDYSITGGTASEGNDYVATSGTATILTGQLNTTFTLDLNNDVVDEQNETIVLSLSNPSANANLGANNQLIVSLIDDDDGPTVALSDTTIFINEGSVTNSVLLTLDAASGTDIMIDYTVSSLSAVSGSDYVLSDGTLSIPSGNSSGVLNFNIVDDADVETQESFAIKLSNPVNATLDADYDSLVITINDNDDFGIDGPGGVGNADGTGTLVMWSIADSAKTTGNVVDYWPNQVGITDLDLYPFDQNPTKNLNAKNGHAEISFEDVNDAVRSSSLSTASFPYNEATTFVVTRHDDRSQNSSTYTTATATVGGIGGNRFTTHLPWDGNAYFDIGSCCGGAARVGPLTYELDWEGVFNIFSFRAGESSGKEVWRNNSIIGSVAGTSQFTNHSAYRFYLAHSTSNNFRGDLLEFVMFTNPLNDAQINIVHNYLAAKYDLTISNDLYSFDATHDLQVIGIGQEAATAEIPLNFHTAAKSSFITIRNPSDLGDGEYIFAGHAGEDFDSWVTSDIPLGFDSLRRIEREWRFDTTGSPGTITIAIDTTKLPNKPTGYADYIVLVDNDGDFASDAAMYSTSLVDGEYVANEVEVAQGTYVTVGILIRKIDFSTTSINTAETGSSNIIIDLNQSYVEDITLNYSVKSGTATQGADYSLATSGSVTIAAGSTSATINPGVIDESIVESDENLVIALRGVPNGTFLGADSVFTYTITDDDNIRDIDFRSPCEYGYAKTITIDHTMVDDTDGSNLTNFPLLISITDPHLASIANSGNVTSSSGYDIAFTYKDSSEWLDHEIESYDETTGAYTAWVKVPSLDYDDNTEITIHYGNSNIMADPSVNSVWSEYLGVWHFNNNVEDSSPNEHNGTDNGTDNVAGQIGQGRDFDGSGDFIELATFPNLQTDFSISAWVNTPNIDVGQRVFIDDDNNTRGYALSIGDPGSGRIRFYSRGAGPTSVDGDLANAISINTWTYVAGVADVSAGGRRIIYVNGNEAANRTHSTAWGTDAGSAAIGGETLSGETGNRFNGTMDEVRVYNGLLSASRVITEYNNYNSPGTFYSFSTQDTTAGCFITENRSDSVEVTVAIKPIDNSGATYAVYSATGGTAVADEDYVLTQDTVRIPPGKQSATFKFPLINDLSDERDETVELTISNPSSNTKIGTNSTITFTIQDDDGLPTISFVDTVSTANEGSSLVGIPVEINVESGNSVTVDYSVKASTAVAGADFVPLTGTLTIAPGSLSNTISFQPIDDEIIEAIETVQIRLFNPQNAVLPNASDTLHLVSINDNDDLGFEGPGGVGDVRNADGEGLLKIWLIADSAAYTMGSNAVTSLPNEIKNVSVDYTMIPSINSPDYVPNAINGHAVISFEDQIDALVSTGTLTAASFPGNELSIFIVTESDNLSQVSYAYATDDDDQNSVDGNSIYASIPDNGNVRFSLSGDTETAPYSNDWIGNVSIFSHVVSSDTFLVRRNNSTIANDDPNGSIFTSHTDYNFYIGKSSSASQHFQGDIAELILYSRELNLAQVNIVNNYLAAKYDLPVTGDLYNFNVTHGTEVAGVGRVDASNQHVAAKAGVLTISNASTLGDGDYILFGHDNGDIMSWTTNESPGSGIVRTPREWRIDTTGSPGSITVAIDTTFLPGKPNGNEDYILILDKDGNFASDAVTIPTILVDGEYKASEVPVSSGDYLTIGIVSRVIAFDETTSNDFENVAKNIQVNLSLESDENITVEYFVTGGTATGGNTDYALDANGSLTFFAGQTTANIPLGIINDSELESDESIEITLRNSSNGVEVGADSVHTYTINDDDNFRRVQFATDSITNLESVDSVYLVVRLDSLDDTNETTVLMTVTGGTAESAPAPDFTFAVDTIKIQPNQSSDSLLVVILDDVLDEETETLIFSLSSPTNSSLGDTTQLVYSIQDNDLDVVASLQDTTITIDEGGSVAAIVVELDNISGKDITIDYAVDGTKSTASGGGIDYSLTNGSVTISKGSEFATINLALTDDDVEESAEIVTIGISGANVQVNKADTVMLTISDNDALSGYYGPGGVGNNENNLLWLDAFNVNGRASSNPADGASLTSWNDNSGNAYVFTNTGTSPTYDSDGLNNRPTINISNTQLGFSAPSNFSNSLSNYAMLVVGQQVTGNFLVENNTTGTQEFRLSNSDIGLYRINNTDYLSSQGTTAINLTTWMFDIQSANSAEVFRDGSALASDDNFSVMSIANNFSIGNRYTGPSTSDFDGNISEVIIFNNPINEAQRIIVENYLAAKYDLTINNDLYNYQGIFYHDVVGIGDAGNQGQHLEAMSDSLLLISNPTLLDSGEFVFIGHDNRTSDSWTTLEAPLGGSNVRRIAREWRIDTVGNPGAVSFKVDINKLPTPENGFTQYVLYIDKDGDFNNGATISQLNFSATSGLYVSDPVAIDEGDYLTIGVIKPVVEFTFTASDSTEAFTNPKIEVSLNFTIDEIVTVNYEASGGTAMGANVDYLLADGTLSIAPGNLVADIDLGVINDALVEASETIEITLANPSANVSLGSNVVHTYTINDNDSDRKLEFALTDSTFAENGTDADSVAVQLYLMTQDGSDTVQSDGSIYALISIGAASTATFSTDYDTLGAFVADTLFIPNGDSTVTFQLAVTDDSEFESSETVIFRLSGANVNIGSNNEVEFTIADNDIQPTVQFVETNAFGQESISPFQIDVELSASSGAITTVNYTVSSTNATQGTDFDLTDGSVTFNPGETETAILLTVNDDVIAEPGEQVNITLSSPNNATLGTNTVFTYTILDNDNLGATGPGGVGESSTNILWLRGDFFDGTTTWSDSSGNNYDATAIGTPSPATTAGGRPVVRFDGTSDAFDIDAFTSSTSDYDVYAVYQTSSTNAQQVFSSEGGLALGHELGFGYTDGGGDKGTEFTGTTLSIYQHSLQSGSNNTTMRKNGSDDNTSTYSQTSISANSFIGSSTTPDEYFNGDLAELIFYNTTLNSAQRKIVETYLADRYEITVANDLYDNPGFTDDIAGIGRDSATAIHAAATSAFQLTVKNANSLSSPSDDGDFMLFGHNNAATTDWDATANPGIIRLRREWSFDVDGAPGQVSVELDLAQIDTTLRTAFPTLSILISSSGDFDTDLDTIYTLRNLGGSIFGANGVLLNDGDVLTIGGMRNVSNGGGTRDFSNINTWVNEVIPGSGDNVFISSMDSIYLSQDVKIGDISIEDNGVLYLNGFKLELDDGCITLNGAGRINTIGSEVEYSKAGDQCVTGTTYDKLTFSSSGRKYLLDTVEVMGDITVSDNAVELDTDNSPIYLGGNWLNQGTFTPDDGVLILNGMSDQSVEATGAGGESLHKMVVNKASGAVLLESNLTVADSLHVNSGILNLQSNDLVIQNTEADHLVGSASGYIQADGAGELFFSIVAGESYALPIGDGDEYSPATFEINTVDPVSGASISINLRDSKYPDISTDFAYISRYWTFGGVNVTSIDYNWTFNYTSADLAGGSEASLEPIKFESDGTVYDIIDFSDFSKNAGANTVTWNNLTVFCSGTGGVEDGGELLPIELVFFEATPLDNDIELRWATVAEIDNDYFTIERSKDGINFDVLAEVDGAGNTSAYLEYSFVDKRPYRGFSYYRLKQTDFDGQFTYSETVLVDLSGNLTSEPELLVYPNPVTVSEGINVSLNGLVPEETVTVKIMSYEGKVSYEVDLYVDPFGRLEQKLDLPDDMVSGNYLVIFKHYRRVDYRRLIIRDY